MAEEDDFPPQLARVPPQLLQHAAHPRHVPHLRSSHVTCHDCHVSRVDHDVLAAGDAGVEAAGPRPRQLRGPGPDVRDVVQLGTGQRLDTVYWSFF